MYDKSIFFVLKATLNIKDAILDKQSTVNQILWYLTYR